MSAVHTAAEFHDLGKLDEENQGPLSRSRNERLSWDHVDAGIAHLLASGDEASAWLVRAHHRPGLPERDREETLPQKLRGGRDRDPEEGEHDALIARVDTHLADYVADHERACGAYAAEARTAEELHGLPMRLALSCLVDADHTDSASYDAGTETPMPGEERVATRWRERLRRLEEVVAAKARDAKSQGRGERLGDRGDFFHACLDAPVDAPLARCEGPVGIGKTLAVTAHLLRRAADEELRHIFVVAPYTNIITQAVKELRAALVLPGENPQEAVAEHHHRADFAAPEDRDLATLWRAPVIVTTAVQFFETLASNEPARLRKLHELPRAAVFLDEAHAALPAPLWPQNWRWMRELAERWGCRFVFASGSLARLWELDRIVERPVELPELLQATNSGRELHVRLLNREGVRVRYESVEGLTVQALCEHIQTAAGPRLVILNTIQSAATVAKRMRDDGDDVLHLSTALCPRDRDSILERVQDRLAEGHDQNWTLVATSCVEAGVDLSFQTAFRERASAASLIQVGGRVNRHGERGAGIVYDFTLAPGEAGVTLNPAWKMARRVLEEMLEDDLVNSRDPALVVTEAIRRELDEPARFAEVLTGAERACNYPLVAAEGRVIADDTVLVVVDEALRAALERREKVTTTELLRLSVQLRRPRVEERGLAPIPGRREIYAWGGRYDPEFLGVMDDILPAEHALTAAGSWAV
ncbi:MAG: CRISPR-associated protein [Gemmatimonadota bacterium]|nr:CRISPR-associated protein [Gemmatimonadota bacterium]